jgi:ribosomal protein L7/L12/preprotein translocase SecE subunit
MAVAVKNAPGAPPTSFADHPVVVSVLGVLYVVGSLGIIFKGLPLLLDVLRVPTHNLVGGLFLGVLMLAAAVGLLFLGVKLLGPTQAKGVRGGLFVAGVLFLVALGLTRWASLWLEYWVFNQHWLGESGRMVGAILTAVVFLGVIAFGVWAFNHTWTQKQVIHLEEGGWFHATIYKPAQGLRVRRGTLLALVIVAAAGVWTLISHGTLKRGAPDWSLYVPFTGTVAVESLGDTRGWIEQLPAKDKSEVEVRYPGQSGFHARQDIGLDAYRDAVRVALARPGMPEAVRDAITPALDGKVTVVVEGLTDPTRKTGVIEVVRELTSLDPKEAQEVIEQAPRPLKKNISKDEAEAIKKKLEEAGARVALKEAGEPLALVLTVNQQLHTHVQELIQQTPPAFFKAETRKALLDLSGRTEDTDVAGFLNEAQKQFTAALRDRSFEQQDELKALLAVPTAVLVLDRYTLRNVNEQTDPQRNVRVGLIEVAGLKKADGTPIKEGEVLPTQELNKAIEEVKAKALEPIENLRENDPERWEERSKEILNSIKVPRQEELAPASGATHFVVLAQLPSVQYTVPLLILAVSLWLAWRVVNLPAFADFLIATEAELNKVSWTTQRRLMQDTVVVLITVVLMAVYLFGVDQLWRVALSWDYIKVLQIPKDQSDKNRSLEQKNW